VLVGALGSVEEDMRRHGTCTPVAMVGSAACAMAMGDGRTDIEGASGTTFRTGVRRGRQWGRTAVGHSAATDERTVS
jgi:hypothetical protein